MRLTRWISRARRDDRGDVTIELCLAVVILILLLGWMYAYGVNRQAHQKVEHAATEGAVQPHSPAPSPRPPLWRTKQRPAAWTDKVSSAPP